jgi:hypothetical protein
LGRERAEEEVPRRQGLVSANGGAAGYWARASRTGQPFIGNGVDEGSTGELSLGLSRYGGGTSGSRWRQRRRRAALATRERRGARAGRQQRS